MAYHVIEFEDETGSPITGLTPSFEVFKRVDTGDDLTPPTIAEIGSGFYSFQYGLAVPAVFKVDGGPGITNNLVRFATGVVEPTAEMSAQQIDEILCLLRCKMVFEVEGSGSARKTYQVVYRDNGALLRKWEVTDHLDRDVEWDPTSRLPVNRIPVI